MTDTRVSNCPVEDVSATALYRACRYSQLSPPALGCPASRTLAVSRTALIFTASAIVGLCLFLGGCRSQPANLVPSVEFSKVPLADAGGPDKRGIIEGRAIAARPGQQIALYALSEGIWWVQPEDGHPFTTIASDSTWKSSTHLGTQYGALLVDAGYKPPNQTESLPTQGGGVSSIATTRGGGPAPAAIPSKILQFSGYEWVVRNGFVDRAGTRHIFDPADAWTDANGALHLRITRKQGQWTRVWSGLPAPPCCPNPARGWRHLK